MITTELLTEKHTMYSNRLLELRKEHDYHAARAAEVMAQMYAAQGSVNAIGDLLTGDGVAVPEAVPAHEPSKPGVYTITNSVTGETVHLYELADKYGVAHSTADDEAQSFIENRRSAAELEHLFFQKGAQ
jgi:hypothetical protein